MRARARAVLKDYYWHLLPLTLMLVILKGGLFGVDAVTDEYNDIHYLFRVLNENFEFQMTPTIAKWLAVGGVAAAILTIFFTSVLSYGVKNCCVACSRGKFDDYDVFCGFRSDYLHKVWVFFFTGVKVVLWSLLLIIPGLVKAYEYSMIPYIMHDHPEYTTKELFAASKKITAGNKMNLFKLDLSFIGWYILVMFLDLWTFGCASFFLNPYTMQANAEAYLYLDDFRKEPEQEEQYIWEQAE